MSWELEDIVTQERARKELNLLLAELEVRGHDFVVNLDSFIFRSLRKKRSADIIEFKRRAKLALNDLLLSFDIDGVTRQDLWAIATRWGGGRFSISIYEALKKEVRVRRTAQRLMDRWFRASVIFYVQRLLRELGVPHVGVSIRNSDATILIEVPSTANFDRSVAKLIYRKLRAFCLRALGVRDAEFFVKFVRVPQKNQ